MKRTVVLKYFEELGLPKVIAKGEGILSERIIELGIKYNIPIVQSDFTDKLYNLKSIDNNILKIFADIYIYLLKIEKLNIEGKIWKN